MPLPDGRSRLGARFAHGRHVKLHRDALRQRAIVQGRNFHQEIVWMLSIMQRLAVIRLAGLQQEGEHPEMESRAPAFPMSAARQRSLISRGTLFIFSVIQRPVQGVTTP